MKLNYDNTVAIHTWLKQNCVTPDACYDQAFMIYRALQYNGAIVNSESVSDRVFVAKKQCDFILKSIVNILYENNGKSAKGMKCGYVYAVTNPSWKDYVKVGSAVDVYDRLSAYQTGSPLRNYTLQEYVFSSDRISLEAEIHSKFDRDNEWVKADLKEVISELRSHRLYPENDIFKFSLREAIHMTSKIMRIDSWKIDDIRKLLNMHASSLSKLTNFNIQQFIRIVAKSKSVKMLDELVLIRDMPFYLSRECDSTITLCYKD